MIKQIHTYIGKALKATVVFMAAFALVAGSLLCCCLAKTAQASTYIPKVSNHCHQAKAAQHKADDSKTCDCCKVTRDDSDQIAKPLGIVPSFVKSFSISFVADVLAYLPHVRSSYHLAYAGPPRANTSVPIYLQLSNLRL